MKSIFPNFVPDSHTNIGLQPMKKSTGITILFVLIFLVGVLGFVAYINHSLESMQDVEVKLAPLEQES